MSRVTLKNGLGDLSNELKALTTLVLTKTAFDIQAAAMQNAPVDTGALKNSIYVNVGLHSSTYSKSVEAVLLARPNEKPAENVMPQSDNEVIIGVAASYGAHVEYGTTKHEAQPFLTPAVLQYEQSFQMALGQIVTVAARKVAAKMGKI